MVNLADAGNMLEIVDKKVDAVIEVLKKIDQDLAKAISTFERKEVTQGPITEENRQVTPALKDTAYVLARHPSCKHDWQKFLNDIGRYNYLTPKQWKFYCVIHKECMGTWPSKSDDAPQPETIASSMSIDPSDPSIPF